MYSFGSANSKRAVFRIPNVTGDPNKTERWLVFYAVISNQLFFNESF
jgi:hypothetical protein